MFADYIKFVVLAATKPKEAMVKLANEPLHVRRLMIASVGILGAALMSMFALLMSQSSSDPELGSVFVAMEAVFTIGAIFLFGFGVFAAYLAIRDGQQ